MRFEQVLEPVTGRAVPVFKGEVLRITLVEGPQCVDFNCFNLHDYKERMSAGHMRRFGFRVRSGSIIWSNPPRFRPMMVIANLPDTCVTDLLGPRCDPLLLERHWRYPGTHTNCQDTFAEAVREYQLTPDDVHDSLNFWMNTNWDADGNYFPNANRNSGQRGDSALLLALMDVLAVPIICGSGDVSHTGNYWFRPVKIEVFESSEKTAALARNIWAKHTGYRNQRTVDEFLVKKIKTDRPLEADPDYQPAFLDHPMPVHELSISLTARDMAAVDARVRAGLADDREDAIRSAVIAWYMDNRAIEFPPETLELEDD